MARYLVGARFPADVRLDGDAIVDLALEQRYRASASARTYLRLIEDGLRIDEIARSVSKSGAIPAGVVQAHCRQLVTSLNHAMLLNLELGGVGGRVLWVWFTLWAAVVARRIPLARRQRFPVSHSIGLAFWDVGRGVLFGMAHWWLALSALSFFALYRSPAGTLTVAISLALPLAIITHEAAHAIAVQRRGGGGFLAVHGLSIGVIHSRSHSGALVHAAGPLLTGMCGVGLLLLAIAAHSATLAVASTPFIGQALTLTVLATDGRLLVRHISGPVE
jgi:hypothetical protein